MKKDTQEKVIEKHPNKRDWFNFIFWTILFLLFLYWVKSWWGLIVVPFIYDAFISRKIPWTWWRKSKSKTVRNIMSWVDAIVFALVAVYFVHLYFFQNYVIPSSSLEKSLLTGDYLFVSKMSYGPRIPNTPLHMPLTSHTLPFFNTKSYIEWPQWKYRRVKGFGNVEQGDIVVFNYPSGDTVAAKIQEMDYYTICYEIGEELYPVSYEDVDSVSRYALFQKQYEIGRNYVRLNENKFGKVLSRPVDMRENYVKRCVGLPGQTLQIKNGIVYTDGHAEKQPENIQFNYNVSLKYELPEDFCKEYQISREDRSEYSQENGMSVRRMPLTKRAYDALKSRPDMVTSVEPAEPTGGTVIFPHNMMKDWTCNDYGPVWIPKKGETMELTIENLPIYERAIKVYEGNNLEVRDGKIYINGQEASSYTFQMDYYWMMGDNRDNSADSRFWGFVPEDHIVGKPILIWLSLDKDYSWFNGKLRYKRLFNLVDNIK